MRRQGGTCKAKKQEKDDDETEEDDAEDVHKPCFFSYLGPKRDIPKWTSAIKKAADIANARKADLVSFLIVNATTEDWQQLDLSAMVKIDLRRHAIAIAIEPGELTLELLDCLTPYAKCSYEELIYIAMKREMLPEATPTALQLQRSAMFGNQTPLTIDMEGEAVRRLATEQCLAAVSATFLEARVEEESKRMLDWAMRDALAHVEGTILMDRLQWLDTLVIGRKTAEKIIRYLKRHILPFLEYRKDVLLSRHACAEALKVDRKLKRPPLAVASPVSKDRLGFFQDVPLPDLSVMREPQRLAFLALKERLAGSSPAGSDLPHDKLADEDGQVDDAYSILMRLRSWLSRMLRVSYTNDAPPWKDSEMIFEKLRSVQAKISPCPLMVALPTGVGKSGVMCLAPFALEKRPRRVLVVCPTIEIRNQVSDSFLTFYQDRLMLERSPRVMLIAGAFDARRLMDYDVFVVTYHLLIGNAMLASYPRSFFDLVLVDEAHHAEASTYRLMREHFVAAPFFYFTGTPYRSDHQALRAVKVYSCSMREALLRPDPYIKRVCYSPIAVSRVVLKSAVRELEIDGFEEVVAKAGEIWPALRWNDLSKIHVLEHAFSRLRALRSKSGVRHQAILQASDTLEAHHLMRLWRCHPDNVFKNESIHRKVSKNAGNDVDEELSGDDTTSDSKIDIARSKVTHTNTNNNDTTTNGKDDETTEDAINDDVDPASSKVKPTAAFSIDIVESGLGREHNSEVFRRLKAGELDAIVHVGMIGEGFDCPTLSVCCIFRRFSSMAPFMQLVGRVMRRINDANATEEDNIAYIVCHPGLGLHLHWNLYNQEDEIPDASLLLLTRPSSNWTDIVEELCGGEHDTSMYQEWFPLDSE